MLGLAVESLNAVCSGLPKESQFQLVTLVREMLEKVAYEPVGLKNLLRNKVGVLRLFE